MTTPLAEVFRHHQWANLRVLDFCAELDEAALAADAVGTYGPVRDTLLHLCAAEERYVFAFGVSAPGKPIREDEPFPGFEELRRRAEASGGALIEIAGTLEPGRILEGTRRDQKYAIPAAVFLAQAINHATEHRAHICTALTQHGLGPPVVDAWQWAREGNSGPGEQ
jgi:uncharacterized damage-inducible protein DinB